MANAEEEEKEEIENKKQQFDEPHGSLENLPFDAVIEMEILPRLPLKSVLRLEWASKPLSPLISNHLRRRYSLPYAMSGLFFRWPISKTLADNFYHALDSKFIIDGTIITVPPDEEMSIIDCCNGLLLCQWYKSGRGAVYFVCNPLTGQWAYILKSNDNSSFLSYHTILAFDPRTSGHYNILHFDTREVHVFSSKTGSWVQKRTASHKPKVTDLYPFFFDGKAYLSSWRFPLVKIFNRQGEFVGKINLPHPALGYERRLLGHSGGRLHYAAKVDDKMLVWILDDCDESRWVLKHSVSLQYIYDGAGPSTRGQYLLRFHPDRDVIFIKVKDKFFSYHMDNGDLAKVCTVTRWSNQSVAFAYSPCYSKDFDL